MLLNSWAIWPMKPENQGPTRLFLPAAIISLTIQPRKLMPILKLRNGIKRSHSRRRVASRSL